MEITFECKRCHQTISADSAQAGKLLACPKCEGWISVPEITPVSSIKAAMSPVSSSHGLVGLVMRSGTQLVVTEFSLYPKDIILHAQEVAAKAKAKAGGFSTGLGFWGSPTWVIGGSLALGALEAAVSGTMATGAVDLLKEFERLHTQARKLRKSIPVSKITNVELITPFSWTAYSQTDLIHNGEPYVIVKTDQGKEITVVWENVEQYYTT